MKKVDLTVLHLVLLGLVVCLVFRIWYLEYKLELMSTMVLESVDKVMDRMCNTQEVNRGN